MNDLATGLPRPRVLARLASARKLLEGRDYQTALDSIAAAEREYPLSGLLWQYKAACHRGLGDTAAAIAAYQRSAQLNDALEATWRALLDLYGATGDANGVRNATQCLERLTSLPAALTAASSLLNEGELDPAETLTRNYLTTQGAHVQGMRLLAQIGIRRNVLDDAELLLEHVLAQAPDYHEARYEYTVVLLQRRHFLAAEEQSRLLLGVDPDNPGYRLLLARSLDGLGRHEQALEIYRRLAAQTPHDAELQLCVAHALQTLGEQQQAIEAFQAAARLDAGFTPASFALANMKTYRFSDQQLAQLQAREAHDAAARAERYQLCFALGKALEDRKLFAESFDYYARGNALKRSELPYNADLAERSLRLQASVCSQEFFARRPRLGLDCADPIFVVGLTRSGSTLIEQILASHPLVDGTLELPALPHLVQQFRDRETGDGPPRYPAVLQELDSADFRRMAEIYVRETRPYRRSAPHFVDKMLANFRDIGLIHLMLPNARIIDSRREARACCFANFKQLFHHGQEYSYSLQEMGRYYRAYERLMDHWDRVLPGKILRVGYEDLVNDLETNVRRMLDYCGLPFDAACLQFHKTDRSVRTVSSEQVRRPLYRDSLEQWRNYEPWLGPLREALGLLDQ